MQIAISSKSNTWNTWFAGKEYGVVVHILNSLAPGLVSMSSLWLVRYVSSSHIGCIPQCKANDEFCGYHVEFLLGSPVPFSVH